MAHEISRRGFARIAAAGIAAAPAKAQAVSFARPWTSPFRVDPLYPHHLVNREGERLFVLNKTGWAFLGCKDPQGYLERARKQGITVIRVALEGTPYYDALQIEMWPWGGTRQSPEWASFNEAYWDEAEKRARMAGEAGIGLDIVLYFTLHPQESEIEAQRAYWAQAVSRLGKYANVLTWEICNEYIANAAFQDAAGAWLKQADPGRPVCTSDGTTDDAVWPNKPWMDMAIVHTCTGSTPAHDLRAWYQAVARNTRSHGRPAFNNESGREGRHRNDDGVHRRKQGWIWCASGGYWTWHSWEGCEGIDDAEYRGPGAEFLAPMSDFFRGIPFWRLDPNFTAFVADDTGLVQATLADYERNLVISYLCTRESGGQAGESKAALRLPNGNYELSFLNPADLAPIGSASITVRGGRGQAALPGFTDDLLVKIARV